VGGLKFQLHQTNFTYFDKHAPLNANEVENICVPPTIKNSLKIQAWRKIIEYQTW
jgi:hypothetical protein